MTIRERLRIIGQTVLGNESEPVVQEISIPKKKTVALGSFLSLFQKQLTDETTVSTNLIKAFSEWVYANVNKLAEEVSKLEVKLYQEKMVDGQFELVEIEEHPILELLDRFNETTTSSDGFYVTEAHLDLTGDAFWYLYEDQIFILQPDHMKLILGDYSESGTRIVTGYEYEITVGGQHIKKTYRPEEIIHFKVPNPQNQYRGKSTVQAAAQSIDTDTLANEALKNFFDNGMIANFVLTTDKRLTTDQIKNLEAQMRASRTGAKNAFKVAVLGSGLKPETIQMSNKEVELLEIEKWLRDKLMVIFENTPASLGIIEDVNRANAEATLGEWRRSVIKPKMKRIVDNLNEFLLPSYGEGLILGFEDPAPEDRLAKIKEVTDLYANSAGKPVITLNEARDLIDYDAVTEEGADEVKQPMPDLTPTDPNNMPAPVKNVNYVKHFRRNKVYSKFKKYKKHYDDLNAVAKAAAIKIVKNRKKAKKPAQRRVDNFWKRVSAIIDEYEIQFNNKAQQFITSVVEEASSHLDNSEARSSGELFNREKKLLEAQSIFAPILLNAVTLAGHEGFKLLGIDKPYIPKSLKTVAVEQRIRDQIDLFATSMLDTDKDILANILAQGLEEGSGIPEIRRAVQDKFEDFTKTQAERVTRTEVARAANAGIVDSYKQSGVVIGKQWLTAPGACAECGPLNGKIVELQEDYFGLGDVSATGRVIDYEPVGEPPMHPNCRCTTVPYIEGLDPLIDTKAMEQMKQLGQTRSLRSEVKQLEDTVDKRTKEYKKIKKENTTKDGEIKDLKSYIKELEKLASDE